MDSRKYDKKRCKMTIEEAIAYFEERRNYNPHNGNPAAERLAIEALRAKQEQRHHKTEEH